MKKVNFIFPIILSAISLSSCSGLSAHKHEWSPYMDNGDGTHMRMCLKDSRHKEVNEHHLEEEILMEPTNMTPGVNVKKCSDCGYYTYNYVAPTGEHVFDREVVDEKYIKEKSSDYSGIFFKSCECGAFGDPNHLFEVSLLPKGFSNIEWMQNKVNSFIDTGIKIVDKSYISYNKCKGEEGTLPKDYQAVEYVESTGTQYVDLDYDCAGGMRVDYIASYIGTNGGSVISSCEANSPFNRNYLDLNIEKKTWEFGYGNQTYQNTEFEHEVEKKYTIQFQTFENDAFALVNNNVLFNNLRGEKIEKGKVYLFTNDNALAQKNPTTLARLYSLRIVNSDLNAVRNLVPCYHKATGTIGFYDLVANRFFKNDGAGEFRKGKDIVRVNSRQITNGEPHENYYVGLDTFDNTDAYTSRIYDASISVNNVEVSRMIPCIRNSDSKFGVYDIIRRIFIPTTSIYDFAHSSVVGHSLEKPVIEKEPTMSEDGLISYTCSICGEKIYEIIPRTAYKVNFAPNSGVKEIRVYANGIDPNLYEVTNFGYTRNLNSFNFSTDNAGIYFEILFNDGYELDKLEFDESKATLDTSEKHLLLKNVTSDLSVVIKTKVK